MKLSKTTFTYIVNACNLAKTFGINSIIFEQGSARALHDDSTVLITDKACPEFEFASLGIGDIAKFLQRYSLVSNEKHDIITDDDGSSVITKITFSAPKVPKIEFRCSNATTMPRVPKSINDNAKCSFTLDAKCLEFAHKAQAAYSSEYVTLLCTAGELKLEFSDTNKDVLQYVAAEGIEDQTTGNLCTFSKRYPAKTFLSVFKRSVDEPIVYGVKHSLRTSIMDMPVYVFASI